MERTVFRAFKSKGLTVSADATRALVSVISKENNPDESLGAILDAIKERIEKREIKSPVIDVEIITSVVADLSSSSEDLAQESTQLFDAFNSPKIVFDERLKSYKVDPKPTYALHGTAESRARMYRERLLFTQQRLLRSGLFVMRGMGDKNQNNRSNPDAHELCTIESLLGSEGVKVLFGMLTQPEEGVWHLEDLESTIRLDLSRTQSFSVLFTEGCQVILQGQVLAGSGVFKVDMIAFPPAETRESSLSAMSIDDPFSLCIRPQRRLEMQAMEEEAVESFFVIVSDLQLDRPAVLEKLQMMFEGYENAGAEPIFVLMGNFVNKPATSPGGREVVNDAFSSLSDAIASCPRLAKNAKFVLVPGPQDVGTNNALPRRPIPELFVKELRKKVAHVSLASNPSRIRFYTQEIVFFREDLLRKMQRHTILPPRTEDDAPELTEQLVESILDQGHLCPLPLHVKPIYWELDYTLRILPLPHLLVLADHTDQYSFEYKGCQVINPGSFSSDYSFVVYHPANKLVEFSSVQ
jgi:DNA polymerase epsilon subunit 2